ncbi:hypothetical protein OA58_22825 [Microcystis aeruginosa NIES-88]|nr:hypothetical protein OA58_22825 [Microcystis aeruginosa NIES-88]
MIANLSRIHSYYPRKEIKLIYTQIIGARGKTENPPKEKNRFGDGGIFQLSVNSGKWEVGKWGSGEAVSSPYHPKTLSPYLLTPDDRLRTPDY